jgi:hypothetical protein
VILDPFFTSKSLRDYSLLSKKYSLLSSFYPLKVLDTFSVLSLESTRYFLRPIPRKYSLLSPLYTTKKSRTLDCLETERTNLRIENVFRFWFVCSRWELSEPD